MTGPLAGWHPPHIEPTDIDARIAGAIFESAHVAMMVTDATNRIVAVNAAFCAITGFRREEALGRNPRFLKSGRHDREFYREMWRALDSHGSWQGEVWDRRKSGETYPKELTIHVVRDGDGKALRYVGIFSDISAHKENERLLWQRTNFDALTGVANRHLFQDRLLQITRKSGRNRQQAALLIVDIDHFNEVNGALGHAAGDALLVETAERVSACVRECDTVARLGADEFGVILSELEDQTSVGQVSQRILNSLSDPYSIKDDPICLSASIGIALFPDDAATSDDLLKRSHQAMLAAKAAGRNCQMRFASTMQDKAQDRLRIVAELRKALAQHQFEIHYQPIVDLRTGRIAKAEALLRWRHPNRGWVSPAEFIPLAEDSGLIAPLGDWILRQALTQIAAWRRNLMPTLQVSVNKSPMQFRDNRSSAPLWLEQMDREGQEGQSLVIEITEGVLLDAEKWVKDRLGEFRNRGIQIAIDDFGTGYSSLAYLQKFDIDLLKIDKTFVQDLAPGNNAASLCDAMIVMAHRLGLKVVAEGAETPLQCALLAEMGCDYAQGHHFSRALPAAAFEKLLMSGADHRSSADLM